MGHDDGFKQRFLSGDEVLVGVFTSLGDPSAAELCAIAGFDVVIVDAEHGPSDIATIQHQLRAVEARRTPAAVRPWSDERSVLKRVLDVGATTLVVPMVESAEQVARIVASVRYPPRGARGVASARAAAWGATPGYHATADERLCVLVQVESAAGLERLEEIAAVDGVDGVFIGPTDLSSSLGYTAQGTHPEVVPVVERAIRRIAEAGSAAAVFAAEGDTLGRYTAAGARLVVVGVDAAVLRAGLQDLRRRV